MEIKGKQNNCTNCGNPLAATDNYCAICGQENRDVYVSFGQLLKDFFHNYFSFDSRLGRSLEPFFAQPGTLTNEFMDGKRMKYINPIRLYIIISLIHFFFFSLYIQSTADDEIVQTKSVKYGDSNFSIRIGGNDSTDLKREDSIITDSTATAEKDKFSLIEKMVTQHSIDEVLDSLHLEDPSFIKKTFFKQLIKVQKYGNFSLQSYILKNIPILMFFLLPVYGLVLKLFFHRRLYIHHAIHSLHIHSFTFLILTIVWILNSFTEVEQWALVMIFLGITLYTIESFKRTYSIKWLTAIWKVAWSGAIYLFILFTSLILTLVISFFTY